MPSSFTTFVICAVTACCGCRDTGPPPLVLGPPTHFKLAVKGSYGVGIELELRVPTGYFERADPYSWSWDRGADDPKIYVSNDPEDRWTTLEHPCGKDARHKRMQSRVELPDGAIATCEKVDGKTIVGYDVYRVMRSIETEIECRVSFGRQEHDPVRGDPSPERRSLAMAICNSLRVVGRSEYDLNVDVMQRGFGNPN